MINIVIPAFNEEKLLPRVLEQLLQDDQLTASRLVIVLNGCVDNSLTVVNEFISNNDKQLQDKHLTMKCIEVKKASKTNAINVGLDFLKESSVQVDSEEVVVLLDADILISGKSIVQLAEELERSNQLAMSPKVDFDYQNSSYWVKHYYQVAAFSTYNQEKRLSNVIALSAKGVEKIGNIPEVIADDEYIRRQLTEDQYSVSQNLKHTFTTPKNVSNLIKVLARVERGNLLLNKNYGPSKKLNLHASSAKPSLISMAVFVAVKLCAKLLARIQLLTNNHSWGRDESTRL